jgi:glycosyltransferase involved in cell wall biosynthesis
MASGEASTPKKINILYLIDTLRDGGGTETHLAEVSARLDRKRFNCFICAFDCEQGPFVKRIEENTPVAYIPVGRFYGINAVIQAFNLIKFIRENHIDIVQTFHFKSDTYGVLVSKLAGVRRIISSRRDLGDLKESRHLMLNRLLNPFVDHFIMVCNTVAEAVKKTEGVPEERMTTIYNGVNLNSFNLDRERDVVSLKKELGISPDAFVIGSIAYFRPEKAYHILFEAIEKLDKSLKEWDLVILGDGPLEDHFKALCRKKGLEDRVKFMGSVIDVPRYISLMDVVCLVPNKNEGFSNAILEGMAMAKPIIATDVGGNAEAVIDGETGFIIPPDNTERVAEAILKLYNDWDLRKKMGKKGREVIDKKFVLQDMISKMEDLYTKICQERDL